MILGLLAPTLVDRSNQPRWTVLLAIGVVFAIGFTAKIIIVPMVILLVATLRFRGLLIAGVTTLAVSALVLVPVYDLLPRMFGWFTNLARSSGRYGGDSPSSMTSNLQVGLSIVTRDYGLTWLVMGIFIAALVLSLGYQQAGITWSQRIPAIGVAATVAATVAMSFKESTDRDFILLVALVPSLAALTALWIRRCLVRMPSSRDVRSWAMLVVTLGFLLTVMVLQNFRSLMEISEIRENSDMQVALLEEASQVESVVAHSFLAQNQYFALMMGSEWAHHPYSSVILARFPNNLYYNAFWSTVFGERVDQSVGLLGCRDLDSLINDEGLTFVLPGNFTEVGGQETPGSIELIDGTTLTYVPNDVRLFGERLSRVPIKACVPPG